MIKRKTETVTIKQKKTIEEKYFCDKCGGEIELHSCYDREKNKILFQEGSVFPEGGTIEFTHAYLCSDCAPIIMKLLVENGIVFESGEIDY